MKEDKIKLSIIIPAYNEEKRILPTLKEYYSFFREKFGSSFEIIIVPNNCSDNTYKVSMDFSKNKKQVRVFNIPEYSGKGGAVLKGFSLAKGSFVGFSDADKSTNAENFFKIYNNLSSFQGAIGSRWIKGASVSPKRSFWDRTNSLIFNVLERIFVGLDYKDTQCGAKIFDKEVIKLFLDKATEKGWIFDLDLLYLCKKNKFEIKEVPISWSDSEGTKLLFKDKVRSFFEVIKYGFNGPRKSWKQFIIFAIIGTISTLIHLGLLYFLTDFVKFYYLLSSIFGFIVALWVNFLGNKFWAFSK